MTSRVLATRQPGEFRGITRKHIFLPENPPELILVVGPCRTGTTALSNVFARAGIPSHMQAIKSMRRAFEEGQPVVDLRIDSSSSVFLEKETLGPKTDAEFFDPVTELLDAGYPVNKLHLIGMCREPRATLASWVKSWGELGKRVPFKGLTQSFQLLDRVMDAARAEGVRTTYYVQEAIAVADPDKIVERLFERTGVPSSRGKGLTDWRDGPVFGQPGSNIIFYDDPPPNFIAGVVTGRGYSYRVLVAELSRYQESLLKEEGVVDIYEKFVRGCERDLGIAILEK